MDLDTSMGGNQSRFPETRRSAVIDFNNGDPVLRDSAAEALISAYWKPVYKYIRVRWSRSNEDAKDLTQAFFARFLEKQDVQDADPARGRFRSFLLGSFKHFLANEYDRERAKKRGGDQVKIALEVDAAEARFVAKPAEEVFSGAQARVRTLPAFRSQTSPSLFTTRRSTPRAKSVWCRATHLPTATRWTSPSREREGMVLFHTGPLTRC